MPKSGEPSRANVMVQGLCTRFGKYMACGGCSMAPRPCCYVRCLAAALILVVVKVVEMPAVFLVTGKQLEV